MPLLPHSHSFTAAVTMNNHHYGIYPDHFAATSSLASFFSVISTNKDRQGVPFVSTVTACRLFLSFPTTALT